MVDAHVDRNRVNWLTDDGAIDKIDTDIDGHSKVIQAKQATALMLMRINERTDKAIRFDEIDGFNGEDWQLSAEAMKVSDFVRERTNYVLQYIKDHNKQEEGESAAQFVIGKNRALVEHNVAVKKDAGRILARLNRKDGQTALQLKKDMYSGKNRETKKQVFWDAVSYLVSTRKIVTEGVRTHNREDSTVLWLAKDDGDDTDDGD